LSGLTSKVPFSVAELLIGLAAIGLIVYIILSIIRFFRGGDWARQVYIILITLAAFGLSVYAGFCLLWGVYYYGDDFMAKSGLKAEEISAEELTAVTAYFSELANVYAE
jgi:hypothetical protein